MPMAGFYVLNISPSRSQTHPNLPKGQPILTFPKGRNKLLCLPTLAPPNLPRWGGTDTIACLIVVCSQLIISGLSVTRVTFVNQSLTVT